MEAGEHILCVYGDNFIQSAKYKLVFLPLNDYCDSLRNKITTLEPILTEKKIVMAEFQKEYMDLEKRLVFFSLHNFINYNLIKINLDIKKQKQGYQLKIRKLLNC